MKFLINRRVTISMIFIALTFLGYISYKQLQMELLPSVEPPVSSVQVYGSSEYDPTYIEAEVIVPLEGVVAQCSGVQKMTSNINSRGGGITIEFNPSTNMKSASIKLNELVNEHSSKLPTGFNVSVVNADIGQGLQGNFMTLRVRGDYDVNEIRTITERDIQDKLANIEGIVNVEIFGGQERSVEVELIPELCEALSITPATITSSLNSAGNERSFVGFAGDDSDNSSIFVDGGFTNVDMIGNVVVAPGPIYLKDVATIKSDIKEPTTISRLDGQRTITVSISNESGENLIELSRRAREEISEINKAIESQGVNIVIVDCTADDMEKNINQIGILGVLGALLATVILWFFLHNLRLVICIAIAIPISVFSAFNLFYAFGITINSLTLIGIALAIGMLLDNSIVVLENIYRLYSNGNSAEDAVLKGTKQVWRSIIAATLTTITVFLPFIFTDNLYISLMGKNLGVSIISTLMFSLFVALLLIPMLTYVILKGRRGRSSVFSGEVSIHEKSTQMYLVLLKSVIRRPAVFLISTLLVLFISFVWAFSRQDNSMQRIESDRISIQLTMPTGSTIESNDKKVSLFEEQLKGIAECKEISCTVNEESANITLQLKEDYEKIADRNVGVIIDDVWSRINPIKESIGIRVTSSNSNAGQSGASGGMSGIGSMLSTFGIGERETQMLIKGADYDQMVEVGEDLRTILSELDYVGNVNVSVQRGANEVKLYLDQYTVNELGVTRAALSEGLSGLSNEQSSGSSIKFGDDLVDIVITMAQKDTLLDDAKLKSIDQLRQLQIKSTNGGFYDLSNIAYVEKGRGKGNIQRVDRSRELKLYYSFTQQDLPEDIISNYNKEIDELIGEYPMPSGIAVERLEVEDLMDDFKFLILAAVILIFMILAAVFESFATPFILILAIPLAAIGSLVALILSGNSLTSINALTGFMILIGIVVNGGIILIDYINILRKNRYNRNRAILMSGTSRLRPIMITAITTIVALLPMALGDTQYAGAIGAPFAITVIGGLAFSSVLTLILIPTLYLSMEEGLKWYRGLPKWIYVVHSAILVLASTYIFTSVSGTYVKIVYYIFVIILIPAVTYLIRNSIRIADSNIISKDEPIVIEARNLVKIYDRPNKFQRDIIGSKRVRTSLGLDNKYEKLSDLKELLWKGVLAVLFFMGSTLYFEKALWIAVMIIIWVTLTISIWRSLYKYHLNRTNGEPSKLVKRFNFLFNYVIAVVALMVFAVSSDNAGATLFYTFILIIGYIMYRLARRVESKKINIHRLKGRYAPLKAGIYNIALSIPIIGRKRKPFAALKGVSFTIKNGMFGLLGPNGAGKSTFMRIVTGIYEQSYGTITINGMDTKKYREELQSLIGFLPQEFGTYEFMSAWKFLDYQAILKGITNKEVRTKRVEYVLNAVHMLEKKDALIGSFSGGMKQRIGIALILLNLPRILVVDEPTAGLDPRERIRFRNLLVELSRERVVIFSTHIIEDIASSCNQVAVINKGDLKYFGEPTDMLHFAKDKVWNFTISEEEFKNIDNSLVANHMKEGSGAIKVRYISKEQPLPNAVQVTPSLEDAYLCLLKGI